MTIKEKILKIMSLALTINDPIEPKCGKEKTAVFLEWSPHCNCFTIRIFEKGWCIDKKPSYSRTIATDLDRAKFELSNIITILNNILKYEI